MIHGSYYVDYLYQYQIPSAAPIFTKCIWTLLITIVNDQYNLIPSC